MCKKILTGSSEKARGFFVKGNEPGAIEMSIIVAACSCGSSYYASLPTGVVWVEAESMDDRAVDDFLERKFIDRVKEI